MDLYSLSLVYRCLGLVSSSGKVLDSADKQKQARCSPERLENLPHCDHSSLSISSRDTRKKRICMLTHSSYEADNRVRRYAETLARRGDEVEVIALSSGGIPLGSAE